MGAYLFLFWTAFVIGLSGAMMPGPVLTATISETLKRGFRAGPVIVAGHALLEMLVLVAVVLGLGRWITAPEIMRILGLIGGGLLIVMGSHMAWTAEAAVRVALETRPDPRASVRGPMLAGILTSVSNPYWVLWWATIGLNLASVALSHGTPGLLSFYAGHILSDLAWYSLVAAAVASGRRLCPPRAYRILITLCGLALVGLGGVFFFRLGLQPLPATWIAGGSAP